jgi:hypothetical protein
MVEWLSNTLDMRFYYWTGLSWLFLLPVYIVGAGLITLLWWRLAKRVKRAWAIIVPLYLVLAIGPWVEELWIAWNFGHLCKKDAGIFIYKTVEVEGFYDATRPTLPKPRTEQAAKDLDRGGYRFYEMVFPDFKGGPSKVVHLEKVNGIWTPTVLDRPAARYHYRWPDFNNEVGHKIWRNSEAVVDMETDDTLAVSVRYGRQAPWFFVGLDRPGMSCPRPGEDPLKKPGALYKQVLLPRQHG